MAITKEMLESYLKEKLVGEQYNTYGATYTVGKAAIEFLESEGIDCKAIKARDEKAWKQTVFIRLEQDTINDYRYCNLFYIEIKKAKGTWQPGYFDGGSYDWNFKDFEVTLCCNGAETVEEAIEKAKAYLHEQKEEKDKIRQKSIEIFKQLCEELDEDNVRNVINDLSQHYYTIKREAKEVAQC